MKITSEEKYGLDTNLIIYLLDRGSRFHNKSVKFMKLIIENKNQLFVAQQNIIETERVFVVAYHYEQNEVFKLIMNFIHGSDIEIIIPMPTTIYTFYTLLSKKIKQDILDIYLAATYIDNGIYSIFSNNEKDFVHIPDFNAVNPFRSDKIELL